METESVSDALSGGCLRNEEVLYIQDATMESVLKKIVIIGELCMSDGTLWEAKTAL